MTTRNPKDIMDEAKSIVAEFKAMPPNVAKPAGKVARLVLLMEERGLGYDEFAKAVGLSYSTVFCWSRGQRTTGAKEWPELVQAIAVQRGANLSAVLNAGLGASAPQPETPMSVAKQVQAMRRSGKKIREIATFKGVTVDTVSNWLALTLLWPELQNMVDAGELAEAEGYRLGRLPKERQREVFDASREGKSVSERVALINRLASGGSYRDAVTTKEQTTKFDDDLAVAVQMWRASDGTLHGSPAEARRVSLGWASLDAARRLWSSLAATEKESALEMVGGSADLVLDLADAIRAERAHAS